MKALRISARCVQRARRFSTAVPKSHHDFVPEQIGYFRSDRDFMDPGGPLKAESVLTFPFQKTNV